MVPIQSVRIKRIYEPLHDSDGMRVLVDRIWPRGVTKDRAALSAWLKELSPSTDLRHWFDHDVSKWEEFQVRYAQELRGEPEALAKLVTMIKNGPVTLLYAAHDEKHNNAVVLLSYLKDYGLL